MQYDWYEEVEGASILQGDLLFNFPIIVPSEELARQADNPKQMAEGKVGWTTQDVVVVTQSCDLENEKSRVVLLVPHYDLEEFSEKNGAFKAGRFREKLRQGHVEGYTLIAACPLKGHERGVRVVHFRDPIALPTEYVRKVAERHGRRIRLLPPYREHLAQGFARHFMRVGLPVPIPPYM